MNKTKNLELILTDRSEWSSKTFSQYILEISGVEGDSNMKLIDAAIGSINQTLTTINTDLESV